MRRPKRSITEPNLGLGAVSEIGRHMIKGVEKSVCVCVCVCVCVGRGVDMIVSSYKGLVA